MTKTIPAPSGRNNQFAGTLLIKSGRDFRKPFSYTSLLRLFILACVLGLVQQGWSQVNLSNGSNSATINFSNTTPASVGTNPASAFTAAGFSSDPATAGRLNSNAWAVSGWSDGALAFGGTATTGDYARGSIAAAVTTGGFYAYTATPQSVANPCLMIQPGGSDFAPGTLTLRIKNTGTSPITQLDLSYNLYVRNDQARSNSFNFSHSTDNSTFTPVGGLDYTSPVAADASGWVLVGSAPSRSTTITGLLIAPNAFFYIRWSGADVGGSGSRDEFGLDDISLTATFCPTITFTGTPTNTGSCNSSGQIVVSGVTGGTGPYMYSKDNGANYQSGATFTGLAANTYQVVVKDNNGCTSGATAVVVGANPPPSCSVSGANFVCNNSMGNVYTAPGGMSAYSWSITGNGSIPGSTTGQSVSVTAGAYLNSYTVLVTVTDANGCTSSCSKQSFIYLFTPPANITVNPNPVCTGAILDLSISAAASSTVSWTGEGIVNPNGNPSTTAVPTTSGPHTYSVLVVADNGCSNTASASVTVNESPAPPTITGPAAVCSGSSATLNAGAGYSSYAWSGGGGSGQTATYTNITTPTTYTVTVTSANGCTGTDTHAVGVNSPPSCSITFLNPPPFYYDTTCANLAGNMYSAPAGMSAYNWSILGNGTITSATNGASLTVTAGASSGYNLYLTVTDGNGCTSTCQKSTPIKPSPTCTVNGPTTVCGNSTGNVYSVTTDGSSYSWGISGDGVITSATNGSSVTVTAGASGTYTVSVTTTNYNACSSMCSQTATIEPCGGTIDFSGKIVWENDDVTGVKDASVKLTGSSTMNTLTDVNGDFTIATGLTSGNFTLKPTKNINKFNGVTAGDATAVQQHVTFINLITDPYKLVCADVNKNNVINTLDASLITQSLLGNPAANAQFNTSWRFVPTSHTMTNPPWGFPEQRTYTAITTSQTNQNFIGMKIGDVTGDANPANFGGNPALVLRATDQVLESGATIDLRFSADQMNDLAAFQFGLTFDPAALQFVDLQTPTGLPFTVDNFGLYNVSEGEIRAVWAQATGIAISEAAPVFRLRFTALQNDVKLSAVLQLDDALLPGLAYTSKLAESAVELRFDALTGINDPVAVSGLNLRVLPNPFREQTTVSFTIPEACEAQLRVFDVNGRELLRVNNTYPAGNNSEVLRLEGITASGVLTCELVTPFGVATQKLVKAN